MVSMCGCSGCGVDYLPGFFNIVADSNFFLKSGEFGQWKRDILNVCRLEVCHGSFWAGLRLVGLVAPDIPRKWVSIERMCWVLARYLLKGKAEERAISSMKGGGGAVSLDMVLIDDRCVLVM